MPQVQVDIAQAGAISALVEWLRPKPSAESALGPPSMAARALADIGMQNLETQTTIANAGAIPPLIKMVADASSDVDGAVHAAGALATLAQENPQNVSVIAQKGGIGSLVELLRDARINNDNATRTHPLDRTSAPLMPPLP